MTCILKLLFSSEKKKKPDVKEKLSESESNSLWEMRKEYFIEGKGAYERELVRLAVNASFEE